MNDGPIDLDDTRQSRPSTLRVRSVGDLQGKTIPERDWLIPSVLIRRSITLFGGDGGVGKSLMSMQLQIAAALGKDWLGIQIPRPISSFGFYCEDDDDELDRRFQTICAHYGCKFSDVGDMVRYVSRVGEPDNEMVAYRGKSDVAKAARTATFGQVQDEIKTWGTELIVLDTVSDIFAGNENYRYQVKSFVTILRRLAIINNGGVVLTAHPSKSSMQDGSGFSGSTAWNGAVRNRLYLSTPKRKGDEDDDGPTDERILKIMKSNYSPFGEKIKIQWQSGVFVPTETSGRGSLIDRLADNDRVLKAVEYLIQRGAKLSAAPKARNALVNEIRDLPSCKDLSWAGAIKIQDALLQSGQLVLVEVGPPSGRYTFIRPAHMKYPGEKD